MSIGPNDTTCPICGAPYWSRSGHVCPLLPPPSPRSPAMPSDPRTDAEAVEGAIKWTPEDVEELIAHYQARRDVWSRDTAAAFRSLLSETATLRAALAEAEAENERWRAAKGPFDEALCDLMGMLIFTPHWPDPMREGSEQGAEQDYRDACQNIVDAVRAALRTPAEEARDGER